MRLFIHILIIFLNEGLRSNWCIREVSLPLVMGFAVEPTVVPSITKTMDSSCYHQLVGFEQRYTQEIRYFAKLCSLKTHAIASHCHGFYIEHSVAS